MLGTRLILALLLTSVLYSECQVSGVTKFLTREMEEGGQKLVTSEARGDAKLLVKTVEADNAAAARKLGTSSKDALADSVQDVLTTLKNKVDNKDEVLTKKELEYFQQLDFMRNEGADLTMAELDLIATVKARWKRQGGIYKTGSGGAYSEQAVEKVNLYCAKIEDDSIVLSAKDIEYVEELLKRSKNKDLPADQRVSSLDKKIIEAFEARLAREVKKGATGTPLSSTRTARDKGGVYDEGINQYSGQPGHKYSVETGKRVDHGQDVLTHEGGDRAGKKIFVRHPDQVIEAVEGSSPSLTVVKSHVPKSHQATGSSAPFVGTTEGGGAIQEGVNKYSGELGNRWSKGADGQYHRTDYKTPIRDSTGKSTGAHIVSKSPGDIVNVEKGASSSINVVTHRVRKANQVSRSSTPIEELLEQGRREEAKILADIRKSSLQSHKTFLGEFVPKVEAILDIFESNPSWLSVNVQGFGKYSEKAIPLKKRIEDIRKRLERAKNVSPGTDTGPIRGVVHEKADLEVMMKILKNFEETQEQAAKRLGTFLDDVDSTAMSQYSKDFAAAQKRVSDKEDYFMKEHVETYHKLKRELDNLRVSELARGPSGKWDLKFSTSMSERALSLKRRIKEANEAVTEYTLTIVRSQNTYRARNLDDYLKHLTGSKANLDKEVEGAALAMEALEVAHKKGGKETHGAISPSVDDVIDKEFKEIMKEMDALKTKKSELAAAREQIEGDVSKKLKEFDAEKVRTKESTDVLRGEIDDGHTVIDEVNRLKNYFGSLAYKATREERTLKETMAAIGEMKAYLQFVKKHPDSFYSPDNPMTRLADMMYRANKKPVQERSYADRILVAFRENEPVLVQDSAAQFLKVGDPLNDKMVKEVVKTLDTPADKRTPLQKLLVENYTKNSNLPTEVDILAMKIRMAHKGRKMSDNEKSQLSKLLSPDANPPLSKELRAKLQDAAK